MFPEQQAREQIDAKLKTSGWRVQSREDFNPMASLGVAVANYPTSTGPADYVLCVAGVPVGVIEAKKGELGENITTVEQQFSRYANSTIKYAKAETAIRFVYEATDSLTRFTDLADAKHRSRKLFTFHRPETLQAWLAKANDTLRNKMKTYPPLDAAPLRECQVVAISHLEKSFAHNQPRALVQMATGAGKTYTAITAVYRLLKHAKAKRILSSIHPLFLSSQLGTPQPSTSLKRESTIVCAELIPTTKTNLPP